MRLRLRFWSAAALEDATGFAFRSCGKSILPTTFGPLNLPARALTTSSILAGGGVAGVSTTGSTAFSSTLGVSTTGSTAFCSALGFGFKSSKSILPTILTPLVSSAFTATSFGFSGCVNEPVFLIRISSCSNISGRFGAGFCTGSATSSLRILPIASCLASSFTILSP